MNVKLAKKLRRQARKITKGLVLTDYRRNANTNSLELVPDCTRFVYKQLKKQASI